MSTNPAVHPQFKKLWARKNSAILVWPGDQDPLRIAYNACPIVIPPRTIVSRVSPQGAAAIPGSIWTHPPAVLNGRELAGTVVIEDVRVLTSEGGYKLTLDIDYVCHYLTRERDDLFNQGFNVVEDASQVEEAMAIGIPLYAAAQDQNARDILNREAARQSAYKERGETPPPALSQAKILWAIEHLRKRPQQQAVAMDDITAVLEGRGTSVKPLPPVPPPADLEPVNAPVNVAAAAAVFERASQLGIALNNAQLGSLLKGNPETVKKVSLLIEAKLAQQGAQVPANA